VQVAARLSRQADTTLNKENTASQPLQRRLTAGARLATGDRLQCEEVGFKKHELTGSRASPSPLLCPGLSGMGCSRIIFSDLPRIVSLPAPFSLQLWSLEGLEG
jgi:hypothetical protein